MKILKTKDGFGKTFEIYASRGKCDVCKLPEVCVTFLKRNEVQHKIETVRICANCAESIFSTAIPMFLKIERGLDKIRK